VIGKLGADRTSAAGFQSTSSPLAERATPTVSKLDTSRLQFDSPSDPAARMVKLSVGAYDVLQSGRPRGEKGMGGGAVGCLRYMRRVG
jgi:hypothetical protein